MEYQLADRADRPPVIVTANGCSGAVNINISYVIEVREQDTHRTFAAALQAAEEGRGPWPQLMK